MLPSSLRPQFLSACLGLLMTASVSADVVHDEAVDGDLSDSAAAPTVLAFGPGGNRVSGTMTNNGDTRDFFTFTVPAGGALVEIRQVLYSDGFGSFGSVGYHAINAGSTSFVPGFGTANAFLGGNHLFNLPGGDLLPELAAATSNGIGFTVPLGPGDYSYIIQQTGPQMTGYTLEFVIEDDWTDQGGALAGVAGEPELDAVGYLSSGSLNEVSLTRGAPSAQAGLFVSIASVPVPFKGGTLQAFPFLIDPLLLATDSTGGFSLSFTWPVGVPSGASLWVQAAVQDGAAPNGVSLSNAARGVVP